MTIRSKVVLLAATLLLAACASTGLNAAARVQQLRTGMTPVEVRALLGNPTGVRSAPAAEQWTYSLHANWKGWVPHVLVFTGNPAVLRSWWADEEKFRRDQAELERRWAPVVEALQRDQRSASPSSSSSSSSTPAGASEECRRARTYEDRMCHCHGLC